MENTIIRKLRELLVDGIDSECKVVYFLVEIRKLLAPFVECPPSLNLFCQWALHVQLSGTDTIKHFLEMMDEYVACVFRDVPIEEFNSGKTFHKETRIRQELASLETFRKELRQFLAEKDLPEDLCNDEPWRRFLHFYSSVVEDGALAIRGDLPLREIKRVFFRKPTSLEKYISPCQMGWIIELVRLGPDGKCKGLDVAAGSDEAMPFTYHHQILTHKELVQRCPEYF